MDLNSLLDGQNAVVAAVIWALTLGVKSAVGDSRLGERLLPVIPLVFGAAAGAAGLTASDATDMAHKVVAGIAVAIATMVAHKVGRTTVLGQGLADIEAAFESAPAAAPAAPPAPAAPKEA